MTSTEGMEVVSPSQPAESSSLISRDKEEDDSGVNMVPPKKNPFCCRPAFSWTLTCIFAVLAAVFIGLYVVSLPVVTLGTCPDDDQPNVILFIGDGFGPQMTSLVRLFYNPEVKGDEPFTMLNDPKSQCQLSFTQTLSASSYVTDSAASGTALSTGYKTTNHYLGVRLDPRDPKHSDKAEPIGNILEAAKLKGYNTGVVVTCELTHATPAAFTAHVEERGDIQFIALQQATLQKGFIDLFIGGGRIDYENETRSDKRDLVGEMRNNGYSIAYTKKELMKVDKLPLLCLLASNHLPYKIDINHTEGGDNIPTLRESVDKAIKLMRASGKPFFLMVEGSKIDMAAHSNDLAAAVYEAKDFLDALNSAISDANKHGDTIIMSTSDHDTGGLSINKGVNMDLLHSVTASSEYMYSVMEAGGLTPEVIVETIKNYTTIPNITEEQIKAIQNETEYPANIVSEVVSSYISVKWGAHDHTDTNVLLYSCFGGWKRSDACKYKDDIVNWLPVFNDNTDIPKFISNHSHTSLEEATKRAVKVFTGHTKPNSTSTRQYHSHYVDPIDMAYHY